MSRTIKVEDHVYHQLEGFQDKKETFSEAIERLLATKDQLLQIASILESRIKFLEWQQKSLKQLTTV